MSNSIVSEAADANVDIDRELIDGFAARLIRRKARQLVRQPGYKSSDQPDLEQEMKLRVWLRFAQFDPAKAHWHAFVTTVIERHTATLAQLNSRQKRREATPTVSLSEPNEDGEEGWGELWEILGAEHREGITGRYVAHDQQQVDLRLDMRKLISRLPEDLRELCELLKYYNPTEAAKLLKVPRTTVVAMVDRIREHFEFSGFQGN